MSNVVHTLRKLKLWQMAALALLLLVAAGTVYAVTNDRGNARLNEDHQIVPVRVGDIINEVAISGSIRFPNQAALGFGISGTVGEVLVAEGDLVEEGQPLARLDTVTITSLQKARAQAQRDLEKAQAAVEEAMEGSDEAVDAYHHVFKKWFGTQLTGDELRQPPDTVLASWGTDLQGLFGGDHFADISRGWYSDGVPPNNPDTPWNESIIYTWTNLTPGGLLATCSKEEELPAGALCVQRELEAAWELVLDSTENPLTTTILQADLTLAQAALDEAVRRLERATIVAPMNGVVTAIDASPGSSLSANATIIEIVDLTVAEVDGRLDEIDVLRVRVGMPALITMDALGGQVLRGTVSYIAPNAVEQQGLVRYPVRVRVDLVDGLQLRQGLTATARVALSGEQDVLMVPLQAVQGTFLQPIVQVMNGNRVEDRPVVLGADDGFWVAVHQGVAGGEQVIMRGAAAAAGALAPGGRGQFGAGQFQVPGLTPGTGGRGGLGLDPAQVEEFRRQFQQQGGGGFGGSRGQ